MLLKYVLPLITLGLLSFAVLHVVRAHATGEKAPPVPPGRAGFEKSVAGVGLVEAQSENIAAGSPRAGVVREVFVRVGQKVQKGDRLFRLDDRDLAAEKRVREAALAAAVAQRERLA